MLPISYITLSKLVTQFSMDFYLKTCLPHTLTGLRQPTLDQDEGSMWATQRHRVFLGASKPPIIVYLSVLLVRTFLFASFGFVSPLAIYISFLFCF